jgi:O-antigen/teichoic acid export membrane protein
MMRPLLSFGGWTSVSNVIGPLMVYMDRFFIGAIISVSAVAYYTTPYEVVSRLTVVPVAIMGVLFPAFSTILAQQRGSALRLFERGLSYILLVLFPLTLLVVTFAAEGLDIWLGWEFAQNSSSVLRWLAVGVFINGLARMPYAVIQAQGRPDITAKLHLIELPIYVGLLWWLVHEYGFLGAAVTWVVRIAVDTVCLFVMTARLLPDMQPVVITLSKRASIALFALVLVGITADFYLRVLLFALALLIFLPLAWFCVLASDERQLVRDKLRAVCFAAAGE